MANAVSGTAGSVAVVSGGTTVIGSVKEWSLDIAHNTPETTAFGDSWRTYIAGIREFSGSLSLNVDPADAAQTTVRNAILNGSAAFTFRFYAGTNYYAGSALVSGISPSLGFDGVWENSADIQGSGALSYT